MDDPTYLEKLAKRIRWLLYDRETDPKYLRWDDADLLSEMAKRLRGPAGQMAKELERTTLPWRTDG